MRISTLIAFIFLTTGAIQAQNDFTKSLSGVDWVKIESKSDITVRTHDQNQILIKGGKKTRTPDRAQGLKLVGVGGSDNTDVGFYVVQDGNSLIVKNLRKSESGEIYLPASQNVSVKSTWNGDIRIEDMRGSIEADAQLNGGVEIKNIRGPITANSLNGNIEVVFDQVSQDSPISIYTTNGAVDVTMPANTPANLTMSSWNGDIYTNFDINRPEKDGMQSISSKNNRSTINNGGVEIKLKSLNGNVYLRKE